MNNQHNPSLPELEALRAQVAELETRLAAAEHSDASGRLAERVKELTTLYRESYLADRSHGSGSDYFSELVALLPLGWQYVEDTCACLIVRGQTYATPNYTRTPWQQRSTIVVDRKEIGQLTVGYLSQHPSADEGPFLAEERTLINEIAKRIGRFIESSQTDEAQRFLAAIVESSRDAIFSETLDGIIQTWNHAAERMFGYAAHEVIGKHISSLLTADQVQDAHKFLARIRKGQQIQQIETKRRRKDGTDVDVALTISPIIGDEDRIVGASFIARDLSEERIVEASLRESDERVRHTFEQAAVGIAHVDVTGRFLRVNQKLCDILGYNQTELLARTFQDITHPADLDENLALLRQMLVGERSSVNLEKRYVRKNGTVVWAALTISLVRSGAGEPKYFISVLQDISRRKATEQALNESEARFRGLFENSPISLWEQDFSGVKQAIESLRRQGITDFRDYFGRHPEEVGACLARVRLLALNRASLALYGAQSVEELLAGLDRLVPPEGYPLFLEELVWIAEGRTSFAWEGVNQRLSGERIYIRLHWSAAPGYEETLRRVMVSIEDISGRRQAEIALQESEARYRIVSELTSAFAFAMRVGADGNLRMEWVTEALTDILRYPDAEVGNEANWLRFVHPGDSQTARKMLETLLHGEPVIVDIRLQSSQGDTRWVRFSSRPEFDAKGQQVVRIYGAGQDITDLKRLEDAVNGQ